MPQNVLIQKLQDFTVQICDANNAIIGTGIAVTMEGKIVTCRHVVEDAINSSNIDGAEVNVRFPQVRGGEEKDRKAVVEKFFSQNDEDIVLLQLKGRSSPLTPEQLPKLGDARESAGNPFKSFGYRRLSNYQGLPAKGEIIDYAAKPEDRDLLCDPLMLESQHIDSGMSGAAVLDVERNLVVGIIAETYESASKQKDRDTSFAVDNKVLTFSPFDFKLETEPYPLKPAPEPKFDKVQAEAAVLIKDKYSWNSAPTVLPEWTGRDDLLAQITEDWNNPQKHVTGLIGFGGEGKSSLARKWMDDLCSRPYGTPDGVFWWGFYENRSIDEFLEAAFNFMSGGKINPRDIPSSSLRAQIIGAMLGAGRYLFVLDGLEVLQHHEGDQYGLLTSNDLRDLLTYFARPDNQSFCLITSRAPVLDLMDYTTYTHRDVDRLSEADGRSLLKKLGVKGADDLLNKVVLDWDGHALTLGLLGSYLVEYKEGDVGYLAIRGVEGIPAPTADEPRYDRVHRVLRRYDEHLMEIERDFLKIFSAFRIPVPQSAIEQIFKKLLKFPAKHSTVKTLSRLTEYRILRFNETSSTYTAHPLIRAHYVAALSSAGADCIKTIHAFIKKYYVAVARPQTDYSKIENLTPLLEAIHHSCLCDDFDGAIRLFRKIEKGYDSTLMFSLGAYDTYIELARTFFPDGDFSREPLVNSEYRKTLYGDLGIAFVSQCSPYEAEKFHKAALKISTEKKKNIDICKDYQNLAETYLYMGKFKRSERNALLGAGYAHRARDLDEEWTAFAYGAFASYLLGAIDTAGKKFGQALKALKKVKPDTLYLLDMWGAWQAQYLLRMNHLEEVHAVVLFNLEECKDSPEVVSQLQSVLGDWYLANHQFDQALESYNRSVKIARAISSQATLVEALIKRGCFFAKYAKKCEASFIDLSEALHYAQPGRCRWYEADIRVALGWAYLANGEKEKAGQSAQRALQMSQEMGYHWGKVDAEEVLSVIASER